MKCYEPLWGRSRLLPRRFQSAENITMPLHDKRVTAFIGPSGCGKSTLLRVLNRILRALSRTAGDRRGDRRRRKHPGAWIASEPFAREDRYGVSETDTLSDVDRISMFAEKSARSGWGQNSTWRHHQGATGPNLGRRAGAPSCDSPSWSAASRSSRSANTTRMRSVFQDPEVGMRAARLQS